MTHPCAFAARVVDERRFAVEGALVVAFQAVAGARVFRATSDADGLVRFTDVQVPISVVAWSPAAGWATTHMDSAVGQVELVLAPPRLLLGEVRDPGGNPVVGTTVRQQLRVQTPEHVVALTPPGGDSADVVETAFGVTDLRLCVLIEAPGAVTDDDGRFRLSTVFDIAGVVHLQTTCRSRARSMWMSSPARLDEFNRIQFREITSNE